MTLKEAVETDIDLDIHNFSDRQKQAVTKLLETCQLVLNSPSLVEDKPLPNADKYKDYGEFYIDEVIAKNWNTCNEANRIARVKTLIGLEEVIAKNWNTCNEANRIARVKTLIGLEEVIAKAIAKTKDEEDKMPDYEKVSVKPFGIKLYAMNIAKAVRQHFERVEL